MKIKYAPHIINDDLFAHSSELASRVDAALSHRLNAYIYCFGYFFSVFLFFHYLFFFSSTIGRYLRVVLFTTSETELNSAE